LTGEYLTHLSAIEPVKSADTAQLAPEKGAPFARP
jgi:hypothetical protein